MRVRASVAGALLALLAGSGMAVAQDGPPSVVVARDGDVAMLAGDDEEHLCVGIRTPFGESRSCETSELGVVDVRVEDEPSSYAAVGAPASAATVEVRRAGRLIASGPTVAGDAYKGTRAGKVRFALLRLPAGAPHDGLRVRSLDAAGALVAVVSPDGDSELVSASRRVLSGRAGSVRWSIDATESSELDPSVVDLGHERVSRCAVVRVRHGGDSSRSRECVGPTPFDDIELFASERTATTDDRCTPEFRLLHGVVRATSVSVLLGDGRRRVARTAALGDGRRVVYALPIGRDVAVRSIALAGGDAGPRVLALGLAPLHVTCPTPEAGAGLPPGPGLGEQLAALFANPPVLTLPGPITTLPGSGARIADGPGDTLCLAVADRPFTALSCDVVAPDFNEVAGIVDDLLKPRAFALALPARVAAIRVGAPGGHGLREIPTVAAEGYAGAYAGRVRFAAGTVTAKSELDSLDLLDGAGTLLHRERSSPDDEPASSPRVVARQRIAGRPGRPSLWQTRYGGSDSSCLALTNGPRPARDASARTSARGRPCCSPRRASRIG